MADREGCVTCASRRGQLSYDGFSRACLWTRSSAHTVDSHRSSAHAPLLVLGSSTSPRVFTGHGLAPYAPCPYPSPGRLVPILPTPLTFSSPPPPHRSLCAGASSHKTSSPSRILAFYYWRPVLTVVCLLNELFFLTLYLLRFLSVADPAHTPVAALAAVAAPVAVAKQVVSAWQVVAAHRLMGATGGRSG